MWFSKLTYLLCVVGVLLLNSSYIFAQERCGYHRSLHWFQQTNGCGQYAAMYPYFDNLSGDIPWVEGNVGQDFFLFRSATGQHSLVVAMQVQFRVFNTFSHPVYTPGYLPAGYYLYFRGKNYLQIGGGHISNGAEGNFLLPNQLGVDFKYGSFCTNYMFCKIGYLHETEAGDVHHLSGGYRFDGNILLPIFYTEEIFKKSYGQHRLALDYEWLRLPITSKLPWVNKNLSWYPGFRLEAGYIMGNLSEYHNFFNENLYRFSTMMRVAFHMGTNPVIGPFVQYYYGRDYYNIRYAERLNAISVGVGIKIMM